MPKYIIEGNINFKEELYKLLDEDSENEDELCQITGLPLKDKYVVLECKHHFNYAAIYKELYKQKYDFNSYELAKKDLQKFRESKLDYFIKCPYCRNIQFTILPYYEELKLNEIYGINSLNKNLPNTKIINNLLMSVDYHQNQNLKNCSSGEYKYLGVNFKLGQCCKTLNSVGDTFEDNKCKKIYVGTIPNTQLSYCKYHYKEGYKIYKTNKMIESKLAAKKAKDDKMNEKKKLLEEKNAERELNGLPPLKRLYIKPKVENIVEQGQTTIKEYVPEEENGCSAILKFGVNKGKKCGCKKLESFGLCKRHSSKDNKKLV